MWFRKQKQWDKKLKVIFVVFFLIVLCNNANPTYSPNPRYFQTGSINVNSLALELPSNSFTGILSYIVSQNSYEIGLCIADINLKFSTRRLMTKVNLLSTSTTQFNFQVINPSLFMNIKLTQLRINYLIKQPTYMDLFYIMQFISTTSFTVHNGSSPIKFFSTYAHNKNIPTMYLANTRKFISLNAFDFTCDFDMDFDIYIDVTTFTQNALTIMLSTNYSPVIIDYYKAVVVFFAQDQLTSSKMSQIVFTFCQTVSDDVPLKFTSAPGEIFPYNTLLMWNSFHVQDSPYYYVQWSSFIVNPTSFDITSTNNLSGKYMKFYFLIILSWQCQSPNAFLDMAGMNCVSTCPLFYIPDSNDACVINCAIPNCLSCIINTVAVPNRVDCDVCDTGAGYSISSSGTCVLDCSATANCSACIPALPAPQCTGCVIPYTLDTINHICYADCGAITNCNACSVDNICCSPAKLVCDSCIANYVVNPTRDGCLNCASANCATCSLSITTPYSIQCNTCNSPYTSSGVSCVLPCPSNCALCSINAASPPPIKCDACLSGYTVVAFLCQLICTIPNCVTCVRNIALSSTDCYICAIGYVLSGSVCNLNCISLIPNCSTCSSSPSLHCTTCVTNYVVSGVDCVLDCSIPTSNCQSCSLNITSSSVSVKCDLCATNYILQGSACVIDCSLATLNCLSCSINLTMSVQCAGCVSGYTLISSTNCSRISTTGPTTINLNFQYITKQPLQNKAYMYLTIFPNDAFYSSTYWTVNWQQAVLTDINSSSYIVQFIDQPEPHLKITIQYTEDLQNMDKTITLAAYSPSIYPSNFYTLASQTISLDSMSSQNNIPLKKYDISLYQMASILKYLSGAVAALYLIFFCIGFAAGKVYILQMAQVLQLSYLSLLCLQNTSPTFSSLSFLKLIFGYNYSLASSPSTFATEISNAQNAYVGADISTYFIQNFNIMFLFFVIPFIFFTYFYFKFKKVQQTAQIEQRQKYLYIKHFLTLETPLYFILWFSLWIFVSGQIQIRNISNQHQTSMLKYVGLALFGINVLIYLIYGYFYIKQGKNIQAFNQSLKTQQQNLNAKQNQNQNQNYFYLIYFIQKIILASIVTNLIFIQFTNGIILSINIIMITLIIILKPYKPTEQNVNFQQKNEIPQPASIRPNLRQIINYSISSIIQVLFLVTNYLQQKQTHLFYTFLLPFQHYCY